MLAESFGDLSFRFCRRDPNRGCLQAIGAPFLRCATRKDGYGENCRAAAPRAPCPRGRHPWQEQMGDSVYRAHHDVYGVPGFDRRDRGAARDAKGAGRGPRSHSTGKLGVSACDLRGYVAVWPSGRRARQGECVPAGRHRLFGRLAALWPFGLARGSYPGTHCSGRRLRGGHG